MEDIKPWIAVARKLFKSSLMPVPHELNELDWKVDLSENGTRVAEHICAFANQNGGGFFVFGVDPAAQLLGISKDRAAEIIARVSNIARDGVEPAQTADHFLDFHESKTLLYVYISGSEERPVHLKGKGIEYSYIRSGGQTRKMGKQEIGLAVLSSKDMRYEELEALRCERKEVLGLLEYEKFFDLLQIRAPETEDGMIDVLINNGLVYRNGDVFSITNLGAILAAKDLRKFPGKSRCSVRVVKYKGQHRLEGDKEKEFFKGYGVGFQDIFNYVLAEIPASEVIKDAIRKDVLIYPPIAIREFIANALIHRDFTSTSTYVLIELFHDRLEITNPGELLPAVKLERIIDTAPQSRNEILAGLMRRMGICEERGSGIDRALDAIELFGLPPVTFASNAQTFKTVIYSAKSLKSMSQEERIRACYQHCCLKFVFNDRMTNASFRKRLGLNEGQYTVAWGIINKSIQQGLIKAGDASSKSKRHAYYFPYWA
ncbi:MAG: putative DNA binding domain-containing protein [Candidatus Omnitrophica bacterium]|nr:putative DNA binding domain-containing protein [Candidatus Omnitrophota bacterium]